MESDLIRIAAHLAPKLVSVRDDWIRSLESLVTHRSTPTRDSVVSSVVSAYQIHLLLQIVPFYLEPTQIDRFVEELVGTLTLPESTLFETYLARYTEFPRRREDRWQPLFRFTFDIALAYNHKKPSSTESRAISRHVPRLVLLIGLAVAEAFGDDETIAELRPQLTNRVN